MTNANVDVLDFLNMSEEAGIEAAVAQQKKAQSANQSGFDNSFYPITKVKAGSNAILRFIGNPKDENYPDFWVTKKVFSLSFNHPTIPNRFVRVNVPCLEMYEAKGSGVKCPIAELVRPIYKEAEALEKKGQTKAAETLKKLASKHWMDTESIMQGFVIKPGFEEQNVPESPIRFFSVKKTIKKLMDVRINPPEGEESMRLPFWACHPTKGTNFIIRKTMKGEYPSYETSGWDAQQTALTGDQIEAIKKYGFADLKTKLPQRPTQGEYDLFTAIVQASIAGHTTWDSDWESELKTIRPFQVDGDGKSVRENSSDISSKVREALNSDDSAATPASTVMSAVKRTIAPTPAPEESSEEAPAETAASAPAAIQSSNVKALADRIRNRVAAKPSAE